MLDGFDGEILGDAIEAAADCLSSDNGKNNGPGCFIVAVIILIIIGLILYYT